MADEPEHDRDEAERRTPVDGPSRVVAGSRPPAASTLVRIGGPDRGPGLIVVAIAVFVVIALVKPWPVPSAGGPTFGPATPPPTTQPTVDPLAAIRLDCQDPPSWRIFSRERWPGGVLRSWLSLEPLATATGPLDPAIRAIPISPEIVALGYCAPWTGPERPPDDVRFLAWAVGVEESDGVARPVATSLELRSASTTLAPPLGALIGPPVVSGRIRNGLWPPGTYVLALTGAGFERWWAVRIGTSEVDRGTPP
ncbi:MAG TPA: hypothetical protein VH440_04455 [Candidatus Limnocylindrales bacterium]